MTEPSLTVVLIEDEKQIRRFVRAALEGTASPYSTRRRASRG
jgi:CheY-like chemotaxis protein